MNNPSPLRIDRDVEMFGKPYTRIGMTYFDPRTPDEVVRIVETLRQCGNRIRLFLGETDTGKSWNEEWDTTGTIGRSMGPVKVPLLVHNRRSMGGGRILDHRIVRIESSVGRYVHYSHPTFNQDTFYLLPSDHPDYAVQAETLKDGCIARFKSTDAAMRYIKKMRVPHEMRGL